MCFTEIDKMFPVTVQAAQSYIGHAAYIVQVLCRAGMKCMWHLYKFLNKLCCLSGRYTRKLHSNYCLAVNGTKVVGCTLE